MLHRDIPNARVYYVLDQHLKGMTQQYKLSTGSNINVFTYESAAKQAYV